MEQKLYLQKLIWIIFFSENPVMIIVALLMLKHSLLTPINGSGLQHKGQGGPDTVQDFTCTANAAFIQSRRLLDTPSPNPDPPLSFSMRPANMYIEATNCIYLLAVCSHTDIQSNKNCIIIKTAFIARRILKLHA